MSKRKAEPLPAVAGYSDDGRLSNKKLPPLPSNAIVSKRLLLRPAIPSPYAGARSPKCVYVSSKTPFLGAVKRVEKLLRLADKRALQSAATLAKKQEGCRGMGKRRHGRQEGSIVLEAVELAEQEKAKRRKLQPDGVQEDAVIIKGTGKAIQKVMDLGYWFLQREEFHVRLKTGSVGAIDDITLREPDEDEEMTDSNSKSAGEAASSASTGPGEVDSTQKVPPDLRTADNTGSNAATQPTVRRDAHPSTRVRYTSVLEAIVSLR